MSSNTGKNFSVTTFGESHGKSVGAVVDGCPAGIELDEAYIQKQLDRRRPGQSDLSTPREESDRVRIVSGLENGVTLGTPIAMFVDNAHQRPGDYKDISNIPRPSHADYTYRAKYGIAASSGGGRASARETIGRVAAGSVAERYLDECLGVEIVAWVSSIADIDAPDLTGQEISRQDVDSCAVRCPHEETAEEMTSYIRKMAEDGDSCGGIVTCVCRNIPAGLGTPVFDKAEALLGAAMLSLPAVKGFEIGSGFAGTRMRGSEHNDMYVMKGDRLGTATNRSGGVQGGITNGEPVIFRVAFKPTASVAVTQDSVDYDGNAVSLEVKGRHDPCVLPRAVPIVESMAAIVIADMSLTG